MLHAKTNWQTALSAIVTDPKELLTLLDLDMALLPTAIEAAAQFPLKVPRGYLARMRKGDVSDPLLRQVLPLGVELAQQAGYFTDPLQEASANPVPGLLHKYHGRVLVTLTSACAIHCRYCFRRHFPYADNNPGTVGWNKMFAYIEAHPEISEVILSGGDPLAVNDQLLRKFTDRLSQLNQIKRLRIHSRLPIVLPERITEELINWLVETPLQVVLVTHANHAQELDDNVKQAMQQLSDAKITLLNQAVLLRQVNDNIEALVALSEKLFSFGILPYYLHLLDKVQGAQHFDMTMEEARQLHAKMMARLPGYLVPRLATEVAGELSKVVVL